MPIWVGGNSPPAVRRATRLGDGWLPAGLGPAELRERLEAHPPPGTGFDVVAATADALDPSGDPAKAADTIAELAAAGATIVQPRVQHTSLEQYLEQLAALAELPGSRSLERGRRRSRSQLRVRRRGVANRSGEGRPSAFTFTRGVASQFVYIDYPAHLARFQIERRHERAADPVAGTR